MPMLPDGMKAPEWIDIAGECTLGFSVQVPIHP